VEAPPAFGFIDQAAIIAQDGSSVSNCTTNGYQTGIAVGAGSRVSDVVVTGARKTGIFAGKSVVENSMVSHMQGVIGEPTFGILMGTGGRVSGNTVKDIRGDVEAIAIYVADSYADPSNTMGTVSHNVISRVSAAGQAPAVCIVVQAAFTTIHDNDCIVSGVGISVQSQETTVYRNHIAGATTPIMDFTGNNDIAVLNTAVSAASPFANIVN
jgi:hypothetical protein